MIRPILATVHLRMGELIAPLYHSLLLQSPSLRSCGLQVSDRRPEALKYYGRRCVKQGGDG